MFDNLLRLCLANTSEPLAIARAATACNATVVVLDDSGAKWMRSKGVPTITIKEIDSDDFEPNHYAKDTPVMLTTMALHAIGEHGQYLQKSLDQLRIQLAREEDRHRDTKDDLTKRLRLMEANRDGASHSLQKAQARITGLLETNTKLLEELSEARRPWWKKWFGGGAGMIVVMLGLFATGCDIPKPVSEIKGGSSDIYTLSFDGCTYIRSTGDKCIIHSATCSNPKHGGVLKCQ